MSSCTSSTFGGCFGLSIPCDDRADCPAAEVCCGTLANNGSRYNSVQCQASCDSSANEYQFCDPNVAGECANGLQCTPSGVLPGYYRCN
jgi:hypothetical protein